MADKREGIRRCALVAVLSATAAVACQREPMSPTGSAAQPVPVTVRLHRTEAGAASPAVAGWFASVMGSQGSIDFSTVDSIMVTLDRVEFLPAVQTDGGQNGTGDEGDTGGWLSLDVGGLRLDLLALPSTAETGIPLTTGDLPAGDYAGVRLFVSDVTAWFNTPIQVGHASFEPNVGHAVFIPSGDQTGIKTDQGFSIPEGGGDVVLVFEGASLQNITATGNGRVILAPVIKVDGGTTDGGGTQ